MRTGQSRISPLAVVAAMTLAVIAGPIAALPASSATRAAGATAPNPLQSYPDCDSLLARLKEVATANVTPYGFGNRFYGGFNGGFFDGFQAAASATPVGELASSEGSDYSGTNNQEPGVDEPDLVKTDGRRMVVLRGGVLTVIDVRKPAQPVRRARLTLLTGNLNFGDGSLLLNGDRVLALLPRWKPFDEGSGPDGPFSDGEPVTDIVEVSISDPARPKVLDRVTLDGAVAAARMVGPSARVVVNSLPLNLGFVVPQSTRSAAAALATNQRIIAESAIDDWLPMITRSGTTTPAVPCTDVRLPAKFSGIGLTTVHTIAFGDQVQPASVSLLADAGIVYASPTRLFVTASEWVDPRTYDNSQVWNGLATTFRTDVHEFDITKPKAAYVASGEVRGHPLDQFALSERNGNLRIATTDGPTWLRPGREAPRSESFMTVLSPRDGVLTRTGQVGGIGRGEMIRSVRYDGTNAYVVTFRQIDPFYVLDLADPARPAVVGELKISGYSAYLHPVGPGRLLGVGAEVGPNGQFVGAKATLFDVADPRRPKALSTYVLPGASTQVEGDAKAFLYWAPTNLAVVPMQQWGPFALTGALGLRVKGNTIAPVGTVVHVDPRPKGQTPCRALSAREVQQAGYRGFVVIDCAPGQPVSVVGFNCNPVDAAAVNQRPGTTFRLPADHVLGVCTIQSGQPVIDRSIVIGNRLLTLSSNLLLSSDLSNLKPGRLIDI